MGPEEIMTEKEIDLDNASSLVVIEEVTPTIRSRFDEVEARLEKAFPGLEVKSSGNGCPFQASGKYKDYDFYLRYRWDSARLTIGITEDGHHVPDPVLWAAVKHDITGDEYSGDFSPEEYEKYFSELLNEIKDKVI